MEFNFQVRKDGFIKAGPEYCNIYEGLTLKIDTYYYSLILENQNNQKPFKKLYHQDLEKSDRDLIVESMMIKVMDDIESFLEKIEGTK